MRKAVTCLPNGRGQHSQVDSNTGSLLGLMNSSFRKQRTKTVTLCRIKHVFTRLKTMGRLGSYLKLAVGSLNSHKVLGVMRGLVKRITISVIRSQKHTHQRA